MFITGPVLTRTIDGSYALTDHIQTIPLSDHNFVENLERAPVCVRLQSSIHNELCLQLPLAVNSAEQIEFVECSETCIQVEPKQEENCVVAPSNVSEL